MTERLAHSDKEAARVLGLSVRSIVYLWRTGKLGFSKVGRRVLIPAAELERLLRRTSVKPTQTIEADEPIRPRGKNTKAPIGEVEALRCSTAGLSHATENTTTLTLDLLHSCQGVILLQRPGEEQTLAGLDVRAELLRRVSGLSWRVS